MLNNHLHIVSRGKAKAGDRVLVHGASGAVGLAACQMAKAHGNN
jgi:NADPH2:quinone reductase